MVDELTGALEYTQARRAYEFGRLRTSLRRALFVVAPIVLVTSVVSGRTAAWLPVTLAAWVVTHWRGAAVLRGASLGLLGGAVMYALPLSILRPFCSPEAMAKGAACGTNPGACIAAGAAVGLALALSLPVGRARWSATGGMALGVTSMAVLRCSTLFAGEAFGLLGGLAAGALAATMARAVFARRATART